MMHNITATQVGILASHAKAAALEVACPRERPTPIIDTRCMSRHSTPPRPQIVRDV